jgi:predicted ferric reductase/Ca2+-binding EF-hand superfamily protein
MDPKVGAQAGDMAMDNGTHLSTKQEVFYVHDLIARFDSDTQFRDQKDQMLEEFRTVSGDNAFLDKAAFRLAINSRAGAFADRLFTELDEDKDGKITDTQFVSAMLMLKNADPEEQLKLAFTLFDTDKNGHIDSEELFQLLKASFGDSSLKLADSQVRRLAVTFMAQANNNAPGANTITYEQFMNLLKRRDDLPKTLKIAGLSFKKPAKEKRTQSWFADWKDWLVSEYEEWAEEAQQSPRDLRKVLFYTFLWCGIIAAWFAGFYTNHGKRNSNTPNVPDVYDVGGEGLSTAKAFAEAMQIIFALILFPVTRWCVTYFRETPLRYVIPFDSAVSTHKYLGIVGFICAWGHFFGHISNYTRQLDTQRWQEVYGNPPPGIAYRVQPTPSALWGSQTSITGYIGLGVLCAFYPFATHFPRMSTWIRNTALGRVLNNFNYFFITHYMLLVLFYAVLFTHPWPGLPAVRGRNQTWIYVTPNCFVFLVGTIWRLYTRNTFDTRVLDVQILPGNVYALRMSKPRVGKGLPLSYRVGQYLLVKAPQVSLWEWHPFTISSAPGDPFISLHIRVAGDWTTALYKLCDEYLTKLENELSTAPGYKRVQTKMFGKSPTRSVAALNAGKPDRETSTIRKFTSKLGRALTLATPPPELPQSDIRETAEQLGQARSAQQMKANGADFATLDWTTMKPLKDAPTILLDGPYGAPAQIWEEYETLVLVGAGIGVTPFTSILSHLVNTWEASRCTNCKHVNDNTLRQQGIKAKKVYFYWVVRDGLAPTQFRSTFEAISRTDKSGVLDMHIHITPVNNRNDTRTVIMRVAQEVAHEQSGYDEITGLQTHVTTEFGRPDWDAIFDRVKENHKGQTVGVFYCGPEPLARQLRKLCISHSPDVSDEFLRNAKAQLAEAFVAGESKPELEVPTYFDFHKEEF